MVARASAVQGGLWTNASIAEQLAEAAELLETQGANPFRVAAYRHAVQTVAGLDCELRELLDKEGPDGLLRLPHVGKGIAAAIVEMLATGRWSRLECLRGEVDPVALLQTVPGIGPKLAHRLHEALHVDSLESLESALHDGRVEGLGGFGPRRLAALEATLAGLLGRRRPVPKGKRPSVSLLLEVDAQYRRRAESGALPRIAPKRFNPDGNAWLPIWHAQREHWHFTALYSNTARAHELDRIRDWVVIYAYDGAERELQYTVVTEWHGPLRGLRVVRGRDAECRAHYAAKAG